MFLFDCLWAGKIRSTFNNPLAATLKERAGALHSELRMATITREELLKIAQLSSLKLEEREIPVFVDQVNIILDYVARLGEVQLTDQAEPIKNVNVLRDDVVEATDSAVILAQAPQVEDGYFVVPKILEEK